MHALGYLREKFFKFCVGARKMSITPHDKWIFLLIFFNWNFQRSSSSFFLEFVILFLFPFLSFLNSLLISFLGESEIWHLFPLRGGDKYFVGVFYITHLKPQWFIWNQGWYTCNIGSLEEKNKNQINPTRKFEKKDFDNLTKAKLVPCFKIVFKITHYLLRSWPYKVAMVTWLNW